MGRGDMGMDGLYSLRAIEAWVAVINSNLNGTTRIGYKGSKLKFKGGVTEVVRAPQQAFQGIQIPESALHADQTSIDFSQGSIINSPELSCLAIQGNGFFVLSAAFDSSGVASTVFFTRDGEFHIYQRLDITAPPSTATVVNYLVNSYGLYVLNQSGGPLTINSSDMDKYNPATGYGCGSSSRVMIAWTNNINLQGLKFSKYGSTIFEAGTSGLNSRGSSISDGLPSGTSILQQSLETSNTSLSQTLPELSLASKMFTAVSKIISVYQANLDTVVNLIR